MLATSNPHNLYLLVAAEFGVIGLMLVVYLLFVEWRCAVLLSPPSHVVLARGLAITVAVSGLFNSIVIDHTESLFFVWMSGLLFGQLANRRASRTLPIHE